MHTAHIHKLAFQGKSDSFDIIPDISAVEINISRDFNDGVYIRARLTAQFINTNT